MAGRLALLGSLVLLALLVALPGGPLLRPSGASASPPGHAALGLVGLNVPVASVGSPTFPLGASWPTYGHDLSRSGSATNESTLSPADAKDLHLLWTAPTTGPIEGSLVVADGIAYVGAWDARGVYAFDERDGAFLWNVSAGGAWLPGAPPIPNHGVCTEGFTSSYQTTWVGITSTPAVAGGVLYVGGSNNSLFAFRLNQSSPSTPPTRLWSTDLANFTSGSWQEHYLWSSPLVYNGSVYIGEASGCSGPEDGQLFQVNASSGAVAHIFTAVPHADWGGSVWSSPSVNPSTGILYFGTGNDYEDVPLNGSCAGIDPPNVRSIVGVLASNVSVEVGHLKVGQPCHDWDFGGGPTLLTSPKGVPMILDPNKDGQLYAVAQANFTGNATIASPLWNISTEAYDKSPPAVGGGLAYIGAQDAILAVNPDSGRTVWTADTSSYVYGFTQAGLTYANGLVIAAFDWENISGSTLVVLDAQTGALLYCHNLSGELVNGAPIVSDGQLLVPMGLSDLKGAGRIDDFAALPLEESPTVTSSLGTATANGVPLLVAVSPRPSGGMPGYACLVQWGDGASSSGCGSLSHTYELPPFQESSQQVGGLVGVTDYGASGAAEHFTVVASPNGTTTLYLASEAAVTFRESGLPNGTAWSVTINGVRQNSSWPWMTFFEDPGSLSYAVGAISGYYVLSSGSALVGTADLTVPIRFTPPPSLSIRPSMGAVGATVELTADWLSPDETVTIAWGQEGDVGCNYGSQKTIGNGSMSCPVTVPPTPHGAVSVSASDPSGDRTVATFTITASLSLSSSGADIGSSLALTGRGFAASSRFSVSEGGVGPLACSGGGSSTGADGSFACSVVVPSTTLGTIRLVADDSASPTPNEANASLTISADPRALAPQGNRSSVDVGQSVGFAASAVLGSGNYTFRWTGLPTGCSLSAASANCTPSRAGSYAIEVNATDSNGVSSISPPLNFTVYPDLTLDPLAATPVSVDLGQPVWIASSSHGGSGGELVNWSGLPVGCESEQLSVGCTPRAVGSYEIQLEVTDSNGYAVLTDALELTVYVDPLAVPPTASVSSVDVGQAVTFRSGALGGSGGFTYEWSGLPSGCAGGANASALCPAFPVAGTFQVAVRLTDSNGFSTTSATLAFTAYLDPTVTTPLLSSASIDVGGRITAAATVTGGSGGNSFAWTGLPNGCSSSEDALDCTPATAGSFRLALAVTDSNGFTVLSPGASLEVFSPPSVGTPRASLPSADVGQPIAFVAELLGSGSGGVLLNWQPTGSSFACVQTNALSTTCTASAPGNLSLRLTATDGNGGWGSSTSAPLLVSPAPLLATPLLSTNALDVGDALSGSLNASGGPGGFTFLWQGLPNGCPSHGPTFLCDPSTPGSYSVSATARDPNGVTAATAADPLVVNPRLAVVIYVSPNAPVALSSVDLYPQVGGGTAPFHYEWRFGDGTNSTGAEASHVFGSAGDFTVALNVTDASGASARLNQLVIVSAAPSPSPTLFGLPIEVAALELGQLAGLAVLATLVLARRRPASDAPTPSEGAELSEQLPEEPADESPTDDEASVERLTDGS